MATCDDMNLLEQHNWFTSALQAQGRGKWAFQNGMLSLVGPRRSGWIDGIR